MYRQSPVKSPDIKNIIVVTLTYLLSLSTLAKTYTTTAREPSMYPLLAMHSLLVTNNLIAGHKTN